LVAENALLRAQLDLFRPRSVRGAVMASTLAGARRGDQIICRDDAYQEILAALILPVATAVEVYAAGQPLAGLVSRTRVLVEPDPEAARALADRAPDSMVLNLTVAEFFRQQPDRSVDSIVLRHTAWSDAGNPADRAFWMGEARRVARRQVILLAEFTPERLRQFPVHPEDFASDLVIVNEDARDGSPGREFCVLRNVDDASFVRPADVRAVIVSEWDPSFEFRPGDIVVCDHALASDERLNAIAPATVLVVPLKLLRSSLTLPPQVLRSAVLNFSVLERYVAHMPSVSAVGADAAFVLNHMRHLRHRHAAE
jgi:hypothetical protein